MVERGYPSVNVPALPSVLVSVPKSWSVQLVQGALFAVSGPIVQGSFTANVLVSNARVSPEFPLTAVAQQLQQTLGALQDVEVVGQGDRELDGVPGHGQDVAFRTAEGQALLQTHWVGLCRRGACTDLLHVTGTCAAAAIGRDLPVLRDIVASARIDY